MKTPNEINQIARDTLKTESDSIKNLINYIDEDFSSSVQAIYGAKGRVIITGIGKSAIVAQKIVATMNSTGTPAIFLHAADAIHGDLGLVQKDDIVICISKSGNTAEVKVLVPLLKNLGNKIIAITGNTGSFLAKNSDYVLNSHIEREACPNNLAPTTSTTAQMVLGDALAVCLIECRGFSSKDFARFHPGGALGKQLYLRVNEIYPQNEKPSVKPEDSLKEVILEISSKRLGLTAVIDNNGKIKGVITDGDLRRMLSKNTQLEYITAKDIMSAKPKTIEPDTLAATALHFMEKNNITQLLVVENEKYLGVIHLHDLIKEGII